MNIIAQGFGWAIVKPVRSNIHDLLAYRNRRYREFPGVSLSYFDGKDWGQRREWMRLERKKHFREVDNARIIMEMESNNQR